MHSTSDYDVFKGRALTGWPVLTLSRGEVVFDGSVASESAGRGQLAARSPFALL